MGSKQQQFGVKVLRRLFATYIVKENDTNPRDFKEYARKMGTSVAMLMSNYAQVPDDEDKDEYKGLGDMFEEEDMKETKKTKVGTQTDAPQAKKAKK